jgi:hypothetical protein
MGILSSLGSFLGIGSNQGPYFQAQAMQNKGLDALNSELDLKNNQSLQNAISNVSQGGSIQDALKSLQASGGDQAALIGALSTAPGAGYNYASQQVANGPLTSQAFGKGGSLASAYGQESDLLKSGYNLQPEDYDAYGQAQSSIGRMFGQQEQNLASSLASRGFGVGGNPAMAQFSGLQGNKNEMLGQMQQQIAQNRMNTNMQRLAQTRQYIQGMQGLADSAQQNAFNQNMAGQQQRQNLMSSAAGQSTNAYNAQAQAGEASAAQQFASQGKNLGDALAGGITSGISGFAGGAMGTLGSNAVGGAKSTVNYKVT